MDVCLNPVAGPEAGTLQSDQHRGSVFGVMLGSPRLAGCWDAELMVPPAAPLCFSSEPPQRPGLGPAKDWLWKVKRVHLVLQVTHETSSSILQTRPLGCDPARRLLLTGGEVRGPPLGQPKGASHAAGEAPVPAVSRLGALSRTDLQDS